MVVVSACTISNGMKRFSLLLLDIIALYGALVITLFIRYRDTFSYQHSVHFTPFLFIFALWLFIFYITNLYDFGFLRNNLDFYSGLFRAIITTSAISVIFFYLIPIFEITPKTNLAIFITLFSGIVIGSRTLFNKANASGSKKPLLIVGVNNQSLELAKFVEENPQLGYELKYIMDLAKEGIKNVDQIIKQEKINTVVISPETYQAPQIIDTFYRSLENRVTFKNLSSFYEQMTNKVPLGAINQIWFLENLSEGSKKTYEEMKRFFDIIFAIIFEIIKLRKMRKDAEKETGAVWAEKDDPRTTLLGKFLRKTRIDELPQLWNILRGEMSFVGPRAERPEFHDELKTEVPFYEERYIIKPGLSGWAQINYHYGSSVNDAAQKLQYDLYYIKNRSLILDLGIILKTINIALRQAGR